MQYNNILKDFLLRRKISESVTADFSITWGKNNILGECIIIPVYNEDGIFVFNKYRRNPLSDLKPKYLYDNGGRLTLYGAYKLSKDRQVIITEGEMDCLVCWSSNIQAVSSTGGAMSFNQEMADLLSDYEVITCFDNDEAGGKGMAKVLDILPKAKILLLPDRPGVKDISDYVANGGDLHKLLKSARSFSGLDEVVEDKANRIALWQSVYFHDAYIKTHTIVEEVSNPKRYKDGDELARAKQYPISNLIKFDRAHKACCIFHNEKTSSLHYYQKENRAYCFGGCGKGYDSIDIYMKLNNCSLPEAIKALS